MLFVLWILSVYLLFFFFFFKQKTAYEMRISDWSSDVCSSDLRGVASARATKHACRTVTTAAARAVGGVAVTLCGATVGAVAGSRRTLAAAHRRASDRKSVV